MIYRETFNKLEISIKTTFLVSQHLNFLFPSPTLFNQDICRALLLLKYLLLQYLSSFNALMSNFNYFTYSATYLL